MGDDTMIEVRLGEWRDLHHRLGYAEGLLGGWLWSETDNERAREATERFLARRRNEEHGQANAA